MTDTTTDTGAPLAPPATAPAPTAAPANPLFGARPQERWEAMNRERQQRDPAANPALIMKRDANGVVSYHEKVLDPKTGEVKAGRAVNDSGERAEATSAPADPNAERLTVGDISVTEAELRELMANKAAEDSRKALIPESPKGYKLELPKDLKLPPGLTFEFNPADPIKGPGLEMARAFAHSKGMSQADFSEMMGVYAAASSSEQIMLNEAVDRERTALGAAGPARVDAVIRFLRGALGDSIAKPFIATLVTSNQVAGWEQIMQKIQRQGAGTFGRQGGEPPNDGKVDQKTYDSWNYTQKRDYAERMTARAERGGRR